MRISNNTSSSPSRSVQHKLSLRPSDYARAITAAILDISGRGYILDWEILQLLESSKNALTFNGIWMKLNNGVSPPHNQRYYETLARMCASGWLTEGINARGGKTWKITIAGIQAMNRLNKVASAYLNP